MDIDFVVLWVDGSDPVWQAEKAKYQGKALDDSNSSLLICFCKADFFSEMLFCAAYSMQS